MNSSINRCNKRTRWGMFFGLLNSLVFILATAAHAAIGQLPHKPNIVLIYADDLGAGMLGCYGQQIVKTPHIDRLADQGVLFTRVYSSQYCCPARASLLMGVHDSHSQSYTETKGGLVIAMEKGRHDTKWLEQQVAQANKIKPTDREVFLPQLLKQAGYVTGQFGKLDWGFSTSPSELKRHGWDHYVGYLDHVRAHGYYPTFLWKDGKQLFLEGNTHLNAGKTPETYHQGATQQRQKNREGKVTYAPDVMLAEALAFLKENQRKPMFLMFTTNLPHGPVDIPPAENIYRNNSAIRRGYAKATGNNQECAQAAEEYASMVAKLDNQVGAIVQCVQQLGLSRKTIFIFAADNGHELYYRTASDKMRARSRTYHGGLFDGNGELLDIFQGNRMWVQGQEQAVNWAGLKWTPYEGGLRVPMIVSCPGVIPQGEICHELVANYDHMASFAELAGIKMPEGKDAVSYIPLLTGQKGQFSRDYIVANRSIITNNGWKLVKRGNKWELFNLEDDPEERNDLSTQQLDVLHHLKSIYLREINSPRQDRKFRT